VDVMNFTRTVHLAQTIQQWMDYGSFIEEKLYRN